jgi:hypothetical protein
VLTFNKLKPPSGSQNCSMAQAMKEKKVASRDRTKKRRKKLKTGSFDSLLYTRFTFKLLILIGL